MDSTNYIGMDVHKETVSIAVMNSAGKLVMDSILETKAATILQFIQGLRGNLHVTFEEGTWAAWLYGSCSRNFAWRPSESAASGASTPSRQIRERSKRPRIGSPAALFGECELEQSEHHSATEHSNH
jgi:hypothetical protein